MLAEAQVNRGLACHQTTENQSMLQREHHCGAPKSHVATLALSVLSSLTCASHAATYTVRAFVPGPPGPTSYAVGMSVPGFDPCLGTLNRVDVCTTVLYARNVTLRTRLFPSQPSVPVTFSVNVGMGASFGYFDATGFATLCGANSTENFVGTLMPNIETLAISPSGQGTACCSITNPTITSRFISTTASGWYMGRDSRFIVNSVSPFPAGRVNGFDEPGGFWNAWVDVTFFYSPSCVADVDDGSGTGHPDCGLTIDDLLYYLGSFETGSPGADVDDGSGTGTPDGGLTIDDLLYYLDRFEHGC